jgi:mannitol-1-phosphate 5-dehydrogenase
LNGAPACSFVGFGFGPIQAGLFLYEAFRSRNFDRYTVAEVAPGAVRTLREADGFFHLNVAWRDRVEISTVGPIRICDPAAERDRLHLISAIAEAREIATAVPSVQYYAALGPASLHRILALGLASKLESGGPPAIVYAAENHNRAAEILRSAVTEEIPQALRPAVLSRVQFLNTVIGKMSVVVSDADEIRERALAPVTPAEGRAFLVESFNHILVSRIEPAGGLFRRAIGVFEEKDDLLPFEEAKLYGHNAAHSLAAYLAALRGMKHMSELAHAPDLFDFVRDAFLEESGAALVRKYSGTDSLFTPEGYREYCDDLLCRMLNPNLRDTVERVGRDPGRKLGWDDRLIGTIRLAMRQGIQARRFAAGAAAALARLDPGFLGGFTPAGVLLDPLWSDAHVDPDERLAVLRLIEEATHEVKRLQKRDFS